MKNERTENQTRLLVLMSDFGLSERFVASMKGVALGVDQNLKIYDLTHLIEPYNVWEASLTLAGTIAYWPQNTVFVSVVDPGVGTARKSVVLRTKSGHFVVTPDNGTLTFVAEQYGVAELREIDEKVNRRPGTDDAHTFHGRDVYAYTGARLAAGVISFEQVGPSLRPEVVKLPYQPAEKVSKTTILGNVTKVEKPYGNIVTNIPKELFDAFALNPDHKEMVQVEIKQDAETVFRQKTPYVKSFGHVKPGQPLLYVDSVQRMGLAVNGGNFAEIHKVKAGPEWTIKIMKPTNTTQQQEPK